MCLCMHVHLHVGISVHKCAYIHILVHAFPKSFHHIRYTYLDTKWRFQMSTEHLLVRLLKLAQLLWKILNSLLANPLLPKTVFLLIYLKFHSLILHWIYSHKHTKKNVSSSPDPLCQIMPVLRNSVNYGDEFMVFMVMYVRP